MANWKEYKIEQFADVVGGGTPSTKEPNYYNGNIPWITPKDLTNFSQRHISRGERSITIDGLNNSSARLIPKNSILLTSRAPIGYLAIAANEICTNQGFKSLVINPEIADYNFIYYLIKGNIEEIKAQGSGTTFAEVSGTVVRNLKFRLPPLPTQTAIAKILSSLDDKIELNNQINKELEALAQALFKHWFIDFEFPDENGQPYKSSGGEMVESELGEIPKGWKVGLIQELLEVKYGKDHKHLHEGEIPVYGSGGIMRYANEALYKNHSILIPRKGTLSNLFYVSKPFWSVDTMFYSIIKEDYLKKYLYYRLKSLDLASMNVGSAVPSMTTKILNELKVIVPSKDGLIKFEAGISSFFEYQDELKDENQNLVSLRDSLLPKLISGELEVSEVLTEKVK